MAHPHPEATRASPRFSGVEHHRHTSSSTAMDYKSFLSEGGAKAAHGGGHQRRHLRLIASPVQQDLHDALGGGSDSLALERLKSRPQSSDAISTFTTNSNPQIYRQQHEASTIELFYDLFFVANLAYFTAVHQHVDGDSVLNYLKLFTLLWFTWLTTILYDVRFSMDCVYNRVCKLVHFGVMTAFVFAGPVFDMDMKEDDQRYYKAFALVLFVSRVVTMIEYLVVIFHSRRIKKTIVPLSLTAGVYAISAIIYLITRFVFPDTGPIMWYETMTWYVTAVFEGVATLLIAIFWRSISFKYTHLVERLGLLSLILMGEGILGMVKSVACIVKGHQTNSSSEIGTVVSAVILIYLIWILYFDQIDHHRFGTIRQQVWAILHYPLHVAILLVVEGNTSLIVWNSVVQGLKFVWKLQPTPLDDPGALFATSEAFIAAVNASMIAVDKQFKAESWASFYPWADNLTALADFSSNLTFKSAEWNDAVVPLLWDMYTNAELFVFLSHKETTDKIVAALDMIEAADDTMVAIYGIFDVVILYFYICAGGMLLILAVMYWFGKLHKSKWEFGEIINRVLLGFIIPVIGVVAILMNKKTTGFKFVASNWIIPIVLFGFLIVIVLDNIILAVSQIGERRRRRSSRWTDTTYVRTPGDEEDDMAKLVKSSQYELGSTREGDRASIYSRNSAYQPYDSYGAQGVLSPEMIPEAGRRSRAHSRAASPQPGQVPIQMAMQNSFRPSHARTRSAGYATLNAEDFEDYLEPTNAPELVVSEPPRGRSKSPLGRQVEVPDH